MLGNIVMPPTIININNNSIDISNLSNGVYIINIKTTGGVSAKKIMVNK